MKTEAHSVETPLKHGSRGEIFRRFAERRLYLHLSRKRLCGQVSKQKRTVLPVYVTVFLGITQTTAYAESPEGRPISLSPSQFLNSVVKSRDIPICKLLAKCREAISLVDFYH